MSHLPEVTQLARSEDGVGAQAFWSLLRGPFHSTGLPRREPWRPALREGSAPSGWNSAQGTGASAGTRRTKREHSTRIRHGLSPSRGGFRVRLGGRSKRGPQALFALAASAPLAERRLTGLHGAALKKASHSQPSGSGNKRSAPPIRTPRVNRAGGV